MIVVAGESLVDLIVDPALRLRAVPGGGPYNTARTLGRLGSHVAFFGRISRDRFGRDARARLLADQVELAYAEETDDPTALAIAELDANGAATYRFHLGGTAAAGLSEANLPAVVRARPAAIHLGTLGLVLEPLASTVEALVAGVGASTLVMLDVNARPTATTDRPAFQARLARLLGRTDVVKVSTEDLAFMYPDLDPASALDRLAAAGPAVVLLTDGRAPVVVAAGGRRLELPVPAVAIVDTVGAGDAFGGGFLHAWTQAAGVDDDPCAGLGDIGRVGRAAAVGIRVAALTVGRAGAEPPFVRELEVVA